MAQIVEPNKEMEEESMWSAIPSFHESKQKECITDTVLDANCLANPVCTAC